MSGDTPDRARPAAGRTGAPAQVASQAASLLRERPWHVAAGASAVGLALAAVPPTTAVLVAGGAFVLLAACRSPALGALAAALVLSGAALGSLRLEAIDAPAERIRDGRTVELRAHLLTRPRASAFGASAEVRPSAGPLAGARLYIQIPQWAPFPKRIMPGAELALAGRLRALPREGDPGEGDPREGDPRVGAPDRAAGGKSGRAVSGSRPATSGFDFAAYLRRRGVAGELLLDRARATGRRRGGLAGALDAMRARAERAVAAGLAPADAALARGMVLGQDEDIAEGVREDFRDSGLAHLLAVSGQNVMLLVALALPLLALAGAGPGARGAALLALVALYVPLAGAGPSLQRAAVMGAAGVAAVTLSRPSSRWYALLLAAAVTLALNPRACGDPGWQLSFAAVGGILVLGVPLGRTLGRVLTGALLRRSVTRVAPRGPAIVAQVGASVRSLAPALLRGLGEGVAITLAATLTTAPLLAFHFGSVSAAALPANLLALPAVAPAMWLGMVKAALGLAAPVLPGAGELAALAGPPAAAAVGYIARLAELFADLPHAQLALQQGSLASVLAAYAVIGAGALSVTALAARLGGRGEELAARWRRLPATRRAAVACLVATGLALGGARSLGAPPAPDALTVRFLDVGQGDATLIQHPDGTAILFDGGPPEAGVARLLRRASVRRLALVVATHASRDHHGGLREVLERYPVSLLLDGGDGTPDPAFRALLRDADRRDIHTVTALAPMTLRAGGVTVRVLSPSPRPPGPAPEDPNPRAVVAVVSADGFDLLLSADAESEALLPLELPPVEAMKVPHHGSSDPGLPEVLDRLRPALAGIEVGPNTYGHPAPSTLRALRGAGVRTYRTDSDGTVTLSAADGEVNVDTER